MDFMKIYSSLSSRKCTFEYFIKKSKKQTYLADRGLRDRFYPCLFKGGGTANRPYDISR